MLDLESSAWSKLHHAYGSAADIPQLLKQLDPLVPHPNPESEPFFSLWSALCHQGDTYTAAYAAVPHILLLAASTTFDVHYSFLLLPTSVEIARRRGRGPEIPRELEKAYSSSIRSMVGIVGRRDPSTMDKTWSLVAAAAVMVAAGFFVEAEAILELEGESAQEFLDWKASL